MMAHCDCIDSSSSSSCRCGEKDRLQQRPLVLDAVRTWFECKIKWLLLSDDRCCCIANEESVERIRYT